jgi:hypothetical protein
VATDLDHDGGEPRDALLLRDEIPHDHLAPSGLLGTADHGHLRAMLQRALELLVERAL